MSELLGQYGILGNVTLRSFNLKNEHGELREAKRLTLKMAKALPILMLNVEVDNGHVPITVDITVASYSQFYTLMDRLGYQWYQDEWQRVATKRAIKVTK